MENYQHFYYALFNGITNLILEMEEKNFSQEEMILRLRTLQSEAEEKFVKAPEEITWEDCLWQQCLILNNGIMNLLLEYKNQYTTVPETAFVFSELDKIMDESSKIDFDYMKKYKEEFKIMHCR